MNFKLSWLTAIIIFLLLSCKREALEQRSKAPFSQQQELNDTIYIIGRGNHYCHKSTFKAVNTSEMKFYVRFNQTAIYQTIIPENQLDINKLWGFSEGNDNHYNSARIGWRYSDGALRLFGYVYAKGVVYKN